MTLIHNSRNVKTAQTKVEILGSAGVGWRKPEGALKCNSCFFFMYINEEKQRQPIERKWVQIREG